MTKRIALAAGMVVATFVLGCTQLTRANFAEAEPSCATNMTACESLCRTEPGSGGCDVARVAQAEQVVAQGAAGRLSPDAYATIHAHVSDLCEAGIPRACDADRGLTAAVGEASKAVAAQRAADETARNAAEVATKDREAAQVSLLARANTVRQGARDILVFLGADENGCVNHLLGACSGSEANAAGTIIGIANQAVTCGPRCLPQIENAETRLASLQRDIENLKEVRATKQALHEANDACAKDPSGCQQECASNPSSNKCVVLATAIDLGDPQFAKHPDSIKALDLAQKACSAGNRVACKSAESIQAKTDALWGQVQAAGDRLASNRYTLAMVLQLRPTARNQRDVDTARRMEPSIIAQQYCPARADFIRQTSADEFRKRAASHCKDSPPTAQGPTGAPVALPQQCTQVFASPCP
jgi:hypothetical protein